MEPTEKPSPVHKQASLSKELQSQDSEENGRRRERRRDKKRKDRKERKEKKSNKDSKKDKKRDKKKDKRERKSSKSSKDRREKKLYLKTQIYFIPTMMDHLRKSGKAVMKRIQEESGVRTLEIDPRLHLPDLRGNVVTIADKNRAKKEHATELIVEEYANYLSNLVHWKEPMRLIILIPEGLVSLFIGYRGQQINRAMSAYGTKIVVNQPIRDVSFRTVELEGGCRSLGQTVNYSLAELQRVAREKNIYNLEKKPHAPKIRFNFTIAKLVLPFNVCMFLNSKPEDFLSVLENDMQVEIGIYENPKLDFVRREERILEIKGKLRQVQLCAKEVIRKTNDFNEQHGLLSAHSRLMMIIHKSFITKLIGARGCMIREIAAKSAGAQIKILSR